MKNKFKMPKLPKINWKLFITIIVIIVLVAVLIKVIPKFLSGGDKDVSYTILEEQQVPTKIQEILPRYKMLERALAARLDDEIYVIVTRGEKLTGGYSVNIDKIQLVKEEDQTELKVYAIFKDPNPDDLVPQVITYPYIVARTELTELPQRVELIPKYIE